VLVDSHCHLADEAFSADLEPVVERARAANVSCALVILEAGNEREAAQARRVHVLWPESIVAVGVHPHIAHAYHDDPSRAAEVVRRQIGATPSARAVGEVGLDYHYDLSPRDLQREVFRAQVLLSRELRQPLVIHTREADEDTVSILGEEGGGEVEGVLHCFTGGPVLARAALDLGFYISFAGIVTFANAGDLRATAKLVPLDRLLTETDSPFLAPVPYRGKRNEPAYVARVVDALAAVHGVSVEDLARLTSANFHRLFRP
jgi:TatD DNase family protein